MDPLKTLFSLAGLLTLSLISGLASALLASLLAVALPVVAILAAGAAVHLGAKLFRRGFAGATVNDVA